MIHLFGMATLLHIALINYSVQLQQESSYPFTLPAVFSPVSDRTQTRVPSTGMIANTCSTVFTTFHFAQANTCIGIKKQTA